MNISSLLGAATVILQLVLPVLLLCVFKCVIYR